MKKIFLLSLCFMHIAYAIRSLPDASKRFQSALNIYLQDQTPDNAQALVDEYDSMENTDKYRRTFDSTLRVKRLTITQLRSKAAAAIRALAPAAPVVPAPVPAPAPAPAVVPVAPAPGTIPPAPPAPPMPAPVMPGRGLGVKAPASPTRAIGQALGQTQAEEQKIFSEAERAIKEARESITNGSLTTLQLIDDQSNKLKVVRGKLSVLVTQDQNKKNNYLDQIKNLIQNLELKRQRLEAKNSQEINPEVGNLFDNEPDIRDLMEAHRRQQEMEEAEARNAAAIAEREERERAAQEAARNAVEEHLAGINPMTGAA